MIIPDDLFNRTFYTHGKNVELLAKSKKVRYKINGFIRMNAFDDREGPECPKR